MFVGNASIQSPVFAPKMNSGAWQIELKINLKRVTNAISQEMQPKESLTKFHQYTAVLE